MDGGRAIAHDLSVDSRDWKAARVIVASQQRDICLDFLSTFEYVHARTFEKSVDEQVSLAGWGIDVLGVLFCC